MVSRSSLRGTPNFGRMGQGNQLTRQMSPPNQQQQIPDIPELPAEFGSEPLGADQMQQSQPQNHFEQYHDQRQLHDQLKDIQYDREKLERELLRERRRMEMMKTDYEVKISRLEEKIGRTGRAASSSPESRRPRPPARPDSHWPSSNNRLWLGEAARAAQAAIPPSSHSSPRTSLSRTTASQPNSSSTAPPAEYMGMRRSAGEAELAELRERVRSMESTQAAQLEYLERQFYGQMLAWRRELTHLLERNFQSSRGRRVDDSEIGVHESPLYESRVLSPNAAPRSPRSSRRTHSHRQRNSSRGRSESPMSSEALRSSRLPLRYNPQVQQELMDAIQSTMLYSSVHSGHGGSASVATRQQPAQSSATTQPTSTRLFTPGVASSSAPKSNAAPFQVELWPVAVATSGLPSPVPAASPQARAAWPTTSPRAAQMENAAQASASAVTAGPTARLTNAAASYPSLPRAASPTPLSSPTASGIHIGRGAIAAMPAVPLSRGLSQPVPASPIIAAGNASTGGLVWWSPTSVGPT